MSIVQRVYPAEGAQLEVLMMHCDHARLVYNLGLEQRSWWTQSRRHFQQKITVASQMRDLTEARREFDWLRAGSTVVQQGALRDLDRAFAIDHQPEGISGDRVHQPRLRAAPTTSVA